MEETKHERCQAARVEGHCTACCLPKICLSWWHTSGNGIGYRGSSLIRQLQIPSIHRRRCFVRSSAWDLVIAEPSQPCGTCGAEGVSSRASHLPAGAWKAHFSHALQTSHHLVGHCRFLSTRAQADHQQHDYNINPPQRDKVDSGLDHRCDPAIWIGKAEGCSPGPSGMKSISGAARDLEIGCNF